MLIQVFWIWRLTFVWIKLNYTEISDFSKRPGTIWNSIQWQVPHMNKDPKWLTLPSFSFFSSETATEKSFAAIDDNLSFVLINVHWLQESCVSSSVSADWTIAMDGVERLEGIMLKKGMTVASLRVSTASQSA